jgi:RHH-type proline utilization regulon transcriptional repressor/proline dehydrogenase/delta 1-pyrroline-5-carboxylate dehydrogenase
MSHPSDEPYLDHISEQAFIDEASALAPLLEAMQPYEAQWNNIHNRAHDRVTSLRRTGMGLGVEAFLQEYELSTQEGVALMCLAEALLRIPDRATADQLIASTLRGGEWDKHIGHSASFAVNASSWGLLLTGKMLAYDSEESGTILSNLIKRTGEPVIRKAIKAAMRLMASQFVLGETIDDAIGNSRSFARDGYCFSYDMLGEGARTKAQATRYADAYMQAITQLGAQTKQSDSLYTRDSISIKLSALHPRYEWRQRESVLNQLLPVLKKLVLAARDADISVAIDAEEATRLDLELEIFAQLFRDKDLADYYGLGFVVQAYQTRAMPVIDFLIQLSKSTGKRLPVRLVKGAYWDSEIKAAQIAGLPAYPVFTVKSHSDVSYLACALKLLRNPECFYPQFATHNALTIAAIEEVAEGVEYEFQRLHGMGQILYQPLLQHHRCRIYAPVGAHRDLLAYLIRRLLENGANSSFIHMLWDETKPLEAAIDNPIAHAQTRLSSNIPLPVDIYGTTRKNSLGIDMGNRAHMRQLEQILQSSRDPLPVPHEASAKEIDAMLTRANHAYAAWNAKPADVRAQLLEAFADLLEARREEAMDVIICDGHRTIPDALAEVREAIDFCRYYAIQARRLFSEPILLPSPTGEMNRLSLHGRGTFLCISPWNFPLAIFVGQVAAALAAGNCVIAKPAEQTSATAAYAVRMMHEAGIPHHVLQLACGKGETVGAALVRDVRVNGIAFTGSAPTAKAIQRTLAEHDGPIIPLIAETGGLNAMIVDSSALLEQATDDIILSAFGSAGQRCSSLRVVFVHQDIANPLIEMISGAMAELRMGDPILPQVDIGPVINEDAKSTLTAHLQRMKKEATFIAATPISPQFESMNFIAPHAFEITDINQIGGEVFGPILHIIRYDPKRLDEVVSTINETGYGLTFGMHSRITSVYESVIARINAGNRYVNRGITGAVVGVQPFGGEGLSGTGPKVGGPYTLLRFATERTDSINTSAIGGNIDLLMR